MEKLKVMVVDDEARMRKLVRDFLDKQDYQVIEAENGEKAVDIFFDEKDIALIILDVMMPKMDGWQVTREIRQFSKVPIIMLTARADERDELLGFELGVDEYISKPFSPKILVARVNAVLRRSGKAAAEDVLDVAGIRRGKDAPQGNTDGGAERRRWRRSPRGRVSASQRPLFRSRSTASRSSSPSRNSSSFSILSKTTA